MQPKRSPERPPRNSLLALMMEGRKEMSMTKIELIKKMRKDGYSYRIKGNGGCEAILYDIQLLINSNYMTIYRYPGSECCHCLEEMK